jgi:hypothetical protein
MTDIDAVKKNNVNPNAAGGSPIFTFDSDLMEEIVAITEEILSLNCGISNLISRKPEKRSRNRHNNFVAVTNVVAIQKQLANCESICLFCSYCRF